MLFARSSSHPPPPTPNFSKYKPIYTNMQGNFKKKYLNFNEIFVHIRELH